ncbi:MULTISPECIES: hypothetical protein [Pantoea]|uniref:Uncharacterized protein n=1 Tax=Candidatus Pantoea floridensis TaxID=1938870 RepID=A0A286BZY8_9GAMM|nr:MULTISPECIES: hypothetical protein [Pantoea]PIF22215.1 hypothetical protein BX596_1624 [Enterobacteriaceae bacterium JKS000233]PXW18501.1 hypothetical protein BY447_0054 [Pantoea sp. JKS000250]SOD39722.1 hypothetical protein SAMN06273570_4176 [Pantoea floridensis]
MKKSWFQHYPMNEIEANSLIRDYKMRGVSAEKTLTADPRFYVVSAFLPVSQYIPRSNKSYINSFWQ